MLELRLADDRLTPFVPVRANYIRWMQQLVDTTSARYTDEADQDDSVIGIDIGTGSTAIYALLACRMRPQWRMVGTDIDVTSLTHAAHNVALNDLDDRVKLFETSGDGPLIPLDQIGLRNAHFVVCNPPFYTSTNEMKDALTGRGKSRPPNTICTGSETEMVTDGGDLGFMLRMIKESQELRDRVQWYSAMPGKLDSLCEVVTKLKEVECTNWAIQYLTGEGGRTRRWTIAWSWADLRPPDKLARAQHLRKEVLPFPNEYSIPCGAEGGNLTRAVCEFMEALDIRWLWDESQHAGLGLVYADVWSRSARRLKDKKPVEYAEMLARSATSAPRLVVKIVVASEGIVLRWMRGEDKSLFESFCGTLKRHIDSVTKR